MTSIPLSTDIEYSEFNYHLLRNALERYHKNPGALQEDEYQQVYRSACKSYELESLVLESSEASNLVIPPEQLADSLQQIRSRYHSEREFHADLHANGLSETILRAALYRELMFDGVMQRIAAQAPEVNELDARLFYEMHHDRFQRPELRKARHILITVNDEFAENTREQALKRITDIAGRLGQRGNRFAKFARQYSECPTAMEGGQLGEIPRGKLFPELDAQLFELAQGQIGTVVESEIGFHILLCEKIIAAKRKPFSLARDQINALLFERRQRNCQKYWLSELRQSSAQNGAHHE